MILYNGIVKDPIINVCHDIKSMPDVSNTL